MTLPSQAVTVTMPCSAVSGGNKEERNCPSDSRKPKECQVTSDLSRFNLGARCIRVGKVSPAVKKPFNFYSLYVYVKDRDIYRYLDMTNNI